MLFDFFQENGFFLMSFVFASWVYRLTFYCYDFIYRPHFLNFLFFLLIVLLLYLSLSSKVEKHTARLASQFHLLFFKNIFFSYPLVLLFIVLVVVNPNFIFDRYHYKDFLGPLADLKGGKAFLVNINSQHGVLIFYFLSLFFNILPLGFKSLNLVITLLFIIQYFCFYFIVRQLFNSRLFSFLCLTILLMVNYFAVVGWMTELPSVGPLRWGFGYLLLLLIILRNQHPQYKKYFYLAESIAVAIAIFWGFEVCVFTLPSYLGLALYESIGLEGVRKTDWRLPVKRLGLLIGFCAIFLSFIYVDIYRRTHELAHWSYYFDYIAFYQKGYFMLSMPPIGGWWLLLSVLFVSFFIILSSLVKTRARPLPTHFNAMVFLTFCGILEFIYYVGRAHFTSLYHISMPGILLAAYWFYWLWKEESQEVPVMVKRVVIVFSILASGIYLQAFIPKTVAKLNYTFHFMPSLPQNAWDAAKDIPRDDNFAETANDLMNKYSGSKKELIYFFGNKGLEVSMYAGRINVFPYNDIEQVSLCPTTMKRIISNLPPIFVGDYIYLSKDMNEVYYFYTESQKLLSPMEGALLNKINQKYCLVLMEERNGISVYRVVSIKQKIS